MDIWAQCKDYVAPEFISHELIRVVESQEQVATNSLVDNLEEQGLLEHMLENTKPAIPSYRADLHYLLVTPFRYPPLEFGSRFGTRFEPGIFYGSHTLHTAFTETAYYRFLFWRGMNTPPPSRKFVTQHTVFGAKYKTSCGLKLQKAPFSDYESYLTDPTGYSVTQPLGTAMREFGIEAFQFRSARDPQRGINAGLFVPKVLASPQPLYQQQWLCETSDDNVGFFSAVDSNVHQYPLDIYLVNSTFPEPGIRH
ncbi:MAG: RES family NAD+ phosphorylase [Gammaproteobacteria bacterium]|jgi:hypothetical protein